MQSNLEFVTDGSKVYRLGGNEWYAVTQDDEKIMLVDTDCKIGDEELKSPWSDGNCRSEDGENGQAILDYVNDIADKYFSGIKYVIEPRTVEAGTYTLDDAYMWPMSCEEFKDHKDIGGKIVKSVGNVVWTRTFSGVVSSGYRYAWRVSNASGDLYNNYGVSNVFRVTPAFNLKKSLIDHITEDGEIILKPEEKDTCENVNVGSDEYLLLAKKFDDIVSYTQSIINISELETKLGVEPTVSKDKLMICENILRLATGAVTEK